MSASSAVRKWTTILLFNIGLTLLLVLLLDVVGWFTGVTTSRFGYSGYNRASYPLGYFEADMELGHDIRPNAQADFVWGSGESSAEIFSNDYGCFDTHKIYEPGYVYLAGDSVAWGYAGFGSKFGTVLEKDLGVQVAKCAVTHSGQAHQRRKLAEFVREVGVEPSLVIVVWTGNDPVNDFLFPQATVVEGAFVDQAVLDRQGDEPVVTRFDTASLKERLEKSRNLSSGLGHDEMGTSTGLRRILSDYSLTANILFRLKRELDIKVTGFPDYWSEESRLPPGRIASANKKEILALRDAANAMNAPVFFLLFSWSPNEHVNSVREFLDQHDIPSAMVP